MRAWAFVLMLLAACGGGSVAVGVATAPPLVSATPAAPVASAPAPAPVEIITPAWTANWQTVLAESWGAPQLGGWIRQDHAACAGGLADPGSSPVLGRYVPASGWALWNEDVARGGITASANGLVIDSVQNKTGFGLLSGQDLDPAQPIRLAATLQLQPDDGAMVGLAVHNGEGNYRQGALAWFGQQQVLLLVAPCYVINVGPVQPGPRLLAVEYHPAHGWRITVDGVQRYAEPINYRANRLQGPPRPGVWAVNLSAEVGNGPGRVRALLGPLTASQAPI